MTTLGVSQYAIEDWLPRLGAAPVERLAHADLGYGYEMIAAHVFRLADGKFALVVEEGCSCYTSEEAQIESFPTAYSALSAYRKWYRKNKRE